MVSLQSTVTKLKGAVNLQQDMNYIGREGGRDRWMDYTNHCMKWQQGGRYTVYADLVRCTNSILAVEYASCRENLKELLNHKQSEG